MKILYRPQKKSGCEALTNIDMSTSQSKSKTQKALLELKNSSTSAD